MLSRNMAQLKFGQSIDMTTPSGSGPLDKASGMEQRLCPFCGGKAHHNLADTKPMGKFETKVQCHACLISIHGYGYENAVEKWNNAYCWKENAKLLREREEIIQQLATERDAFGKREVELMQQRFELIEGLKKYGSHFNSCACYCGEPASMRWSRFNEEMCDCGLKELLSKYGGKD